MSTLVALAKSNRRKVKAPSTAGAPAGMEAAWERAIARPAVPESLHLRTNPPTPPAPPSPPSVKATRVHPKRVGLRAGVAGTAVAGGGLAVGLAGALALERRRKAKAAVAKGRVVPGFVSEFMRSGEKYEAPKDILGGQSFRESKKATAVKPAKGKLLRRVVRKDADDLVMPYLGIPAARVAANPISPLAMLASSNIMIDTAAAAMGKNLSRRERKRAHQMGYGFAGARGMLFSPLGAGRTMVF
jgi:hypothetical protein